MRSFRDKPIGWRGESQRHALAAKGMRTYSKKEYYLHNEDIYEARKAGLQTKVKGIPVTAEKVKEGRAYLISPEEVEKIISRMPDKDLKGLKAIEFVNPKGDQKNAWAQYVRSRRTILLFSQPIDNNNKVDGVDVDQIKELIKGYVIPHEVGHHKALYGSKITDKNISMAEARADANVIGMAPDDKDVKILKRN